MVAHSEFFGKHVHCVYLRLANALDVYVHRKPPHVAVPQDCLDRFVPDAESVQVGCQSVAESVPTVPLWKGIIALK